MASSIAATPSWTSNTISTSSRPPTTSSISDPRAEMTAERSSGSERRNRSQPSRAMRPGSTCGRLWTMRALWLEDRQLRPRDDLPKPARDGEVTVRVLLAGICNTDIELTRGYYPFKGVPGHEFVGSLED